MPTPGVAIDNSGSLKKLWWSSGRSSGLCGPVGLYANEVRWCSLAREVGVGVATSWTKLMSKTYLLVQETETAVTPQACEALVLLLLLSLLLMFVFELCFVDISVVYLDLGLIRGHPH